MVSARTKSSLIGRTNASMAAVSGSENAVCPLKLNEHGWSLEPAGQDRHSIFPSYFKNILQVRMFSLPPKPRSKFLLPSVPTQSDPSFGFLVFRHIRSSVHVYSYPSTLTTGCMYHVKRLRSSIVTSSSSEMSWDRKGQVNVHVLVIHVYTGMLGQLHHSLGL